MFFESQTAEDKIKYQTLLTVLWSLSNLFSDSAVPYLYYRGAERAFCKAFSALDHSRGDTAIDAGKENIGIGLKTFLQQKGNTIQKVAEFNQESANFRSLLSDSKALVYEIARLRNERLAFAQRTHQVDDLLYHCVTRQAWEFLLSEEVMDFVQIDAIKNIKSTANAIHFNDGIHEYNFSITKSTLLKRFITHPIYKFRVEILDDPFGYLENLSWIQARKELQIELTTNKAVESIILPLYWENRTVFPKSGLNQGYAGWRKRNRYEVYIPVPAWIHREFQWFFPARETPFELLLPNGKSLSTKICQDAWKALMSNPNTALGKWLLDEVLKLNDGELVTYDLLEKIGVDSVEIVKMKEGIFSIDFKKSWSYEEFFETHQ